MERNRAWAPVFVWVRQDPPRAMRLAFLVALFSGRLF
jgi:hypothetical protein